LAKRGYREYKAAHGDDAEIMGSRERRRRALKSNKSSKGSTSKGGSKMSKGSKSHKSPKARRCKYYGTEDSVEMKCTANEGGLKDQIYFDLKTGSEGVVIQVRYKLDDKSDKGVHQKVEEEYEVYFSNLIEYLPDGVSGDSESYGFGWSEEEMRQSIDLAEWKPFSGIMKDDDGVLSFYVETEDGIARFNFKLREEGMAGRHLSANHLKVDVTISDFPWEEDDTLVGLLSSVEANTELKTHYHASKSRSNKSKSKAKHPTDVEISFENATLPFGKFVWVTSADVDNSANSSEVIATSPPEHLIPPNTGDNMQFLAFSFLNSSEADTVYWDPDVGVGYAEEETSTLTSLSSSGTTQASTPGIPMIPGIPLIPLSPQNGGSRFGGFYCLLCAWSGIFFLGHVW